MHRRKILMKGLQVAIVLVLYLILEIGVPAAGYAAFRCIYGIPLRRVGHAEKQRNYLILSFLYRN